MNSSIIRQKDESQNSCFKKTKHAKLSENRAFLNPNLLQILSSPKLMIEGIDSWVEKFVMWVSGTVFRNGSCQVSFWKYFT